MDHMNNMAQASALVTQPYPDVGPLTSPYEQQQPVKDLGQYSTLKAVGEDTCPARPHSEKDARPCPPSPENPKFLKGKTNIFMCQFLKHHRRENHNKYQNSPNLQDHASGILPSAKINTGMSHLYLTNCVLDDSLSNKKKV